MTTTLNGNDAKARKTLASQIDRLDSMLDGLADGLTEAVADAVKIAVTSAAREAMQAALVEVLTNQELIARLNNNRPQPEVTPARPTFGDRLASIVQRVRTALNSLRSTVVTRGRQFRGWAGGLWQRTVQRLVALWQKRQAVTRHKRQLLLATGVGTAVAVGAWLAGPWLSVIVSGIGGFCTTLAVQGWLWLRKAFGWQVQQVT
jgi:hypothetical protein